MALKLEWNNEQQETEISSELTDRLEQLLQIAAGLENIEDGEVALSFVDDETIHQMNKEYRGIDRPTDVLSFAMQEEGESELLIEYESRGEEPKDGAFDEEHAMRPPELLGDILISIPTAKAQSEEYGHSLEREIGFLFVHGFLHLIGYDHQDEEAEAAMFSRQDEILQKAGLVR